MWPSPHTNKGGRSVLLAAAFLGSCAIPARAQTQSSNGDAVASAYCGRERAGLSVVELRWPIAEGPVGEAEAKALVEKWTLDVTTYADGFERGLFASVDALAPGRRFVAAARPDLLKAEQPRADEPKSDPAKYPAGGLPGLGRLTITDVATASRPSPASVLRLLMAPGIRGSIVVVRVAGLEGGVDYRWRLPARAGGPVEVICTAARCPVDAVEPAPKRAPRPKPPAKGGRS